jgi:mannose-6-phosphate isomerase-like protein (cupin superfamily)
MKKMLKANLNNMINGWFIGNFDPSLYKTNDVEVAVKKFKPGEKEARHFHKIATEITVIIQGAVKMNGVTYEPNDIIVISPNESTDFEALTEVTLAVVKIPGANNDKYLFEGDVK